MKRVHCRSVLRSSVSAASRIAYSGELNDYLDLSVKRSGTHGSYISEDGTLQSLAMKRSVGSHIAAARIRLI